MCEDPEQKSGITKSDLTKGKPATIRTKPKKSRTWKGRSKLGCNVCKRRRIKCDEHRPICLNCVKARFECDGPQDPQSNSSTPASDETSPCPPFIVPRSILAGAGRSSFEKQTFYRYSNLLAPIVSASGVMNHDFWFKSVCLMSQTHESIFDAFLALISMYTIPRYEIRRADTLRASESIKNKYLTATEWYVRSMNLSRKSTSLENSPSLPLLVLASVIYFHCELRLGHYKNIESLLKSSFGLLHSAQDEFIRTGDVVLLSSLYQLLFISVMNETDSSFIPEAHKDSVIKIALAVNVKLGRATNHSLLFELVNIAWDLNRVLGGHKSSDGCDFDRRLRDWYSEYLEDQLRPVPMWTGHKLYAITRIQWLAYRQGLASPSKHLHRELEDLLEKTEIWGDTLRRCAILPPWELDFRLIPYCLFLVWFWREPAIMARIRRLLRGFDEQKVLVQAALNYMEILVDTGYEGSTDLETDLFGARPRVIQFWQIQKCARMIIDPAQSRASSVSY